MSSLRDALRASVTRVADSWSDADRQLALQVAADLSDLTVRQVAGEDVSAELAHVQASLRNLAAAAQVTAALSLKNEVRDFVLSAVSTVVSKI